MLKLGTITKLLSCLSILIFFISCKEDNSVGKQINTYQKAKEYEDWLGASNAALYIVSEGGEYKLWRDSLMSCYVNAGKLKQAAKVGEELLAENPLDTNALKIVALVYKQNKKFEKALDAYTKLYGFYPNEHYFGYEITTIQYSLGRVKEAITFANTLLNKEGISSKTVNLVFNRQTQKVRMDAALINLQGVILKDLKDYNNARVAFTKAIELAPDFLLAKGNLDALETVN